MAASFGRKVSIYLSDEAMRAVDDLALKTSRSRSAVVDLLIRGCGGVEDLHEVERRAERRPKPNILPEGWRQWDA